MSKYNIYSVQDVLAGFNPRIMTAVNDEVMSRDYKNWAKGEANSADLRLFKIGSFDTQTGEIETQIPDCLVGGITDGENKI